MLSSNQYNSSFAEILDTAFIDDIENVNINCQEKSGSFKNVNIETSLLFLDQDVTTNKESDNTASPNTSHVGPAEIKNAVENSKQFLSKYFDRIETGYVELRAKKAGVKKPWQVFIDLASFSGLHEFIARHYNDKRIWFAVAPRFKCDGSKQGVNQMTSIYIDIDFLTDKEKIDGISDEELGKRKDDFLETLISFPYYPSIIVDSGAGFHLYWLLKEPFEIPESSRAQGIAKIENLNSLLLKYFNGDQSAKDISRVLGLPFTLNYKYNPPKPVVIHQADFDRRYNIQEFEDFFKDHIFSDDHEVISDDEDVIPGKTEGEKLYKKASGNIPIGKRKSTLVSLAGKLFSSSLDYDSVLTALVAKNKNLTDPLPHDEIVEIVDSIYKADHKNNPGRYAIFTDKPEPIEKLLTPLAPVFPLDKLPVEMRHYIEDESDRMQVPPEFIAIPLFVSTAGILRSKIALYPKKQDNWYERSCLWGCVIALPGTLKSPAFKIGTKPLRRMQAKISEKSKSIHMDWEKRKADAITNTLLFNEDEPKEKRLITTDATIEMLGKMISSSGGTTLTRDELSGFLLNMGRYNGGSDLQFFLEGYSGGNYHVDRMTRESVHITDHYINIVGTIQPSVARELFYNNRKEDGFFDRFTLLAYPDSRNDWKYFDKTPSPYIDKYLDLCENLFEVLETPNSLFPQHWQVRWDNETQKIFICWLEKHMNYLNSMAEDDPMRSRMGKLRGSVVRLALVFHCIDFMSGRSVDLQLAGKNALLNSIDLHEDFFIPTWRRVQAVFTQSNIESGTKKIAQWILKDKLESFTQRDIRRKGWKEFPSEDSGKQTKCVDVAIGELVAANWLITQESGKGTSKYVVNPVLHTKE